MTYKRISITRAMRLAKSGNQFYCNHPENSLASFLHDRSIKSSKRGYPDFTVYNSDGSIYGFVEVKPRDNKYLKQEQKVFGEFCHKMSIPFIKWIPSDGDDALDNFLKGRV